MKLSLDMSPATLGQYLKEKRWVASYDETVKIEKPGEGNMNLVLRATTQRRSLILKQANPFVQKYPSIAAPVERAEAEAAFYGLGLHRASIARFLPKFIGIDAENHILAIEDLGECSDFTFMYKKRMAIKATTVGAATDFLSTLHRTGFLADKKADFPQNIALRQLNAEHLFRYPFLLENGFDLDSIQPGLQRISLKYKTDEALKTEAGLLSAHYLSPGNSLLHGDFYPGSWLGSGEQFWVIDPEFSFFGPPEYDFGVFIAHLLMAQTPPKPIATVFRTYKKPKGFRPALAAQFAGIELLRRIIGLAQLPLDLTLEERAALLEKGADLVKNGTF